MSGNSRGLEGLPRSRAPHPPHPGEMASMHGRVVEWLGSGIATGNLTGVLDLDRIAQEFQVSRSLVRECLRTLSAKGMVQARQRTGTCVTSVEQWSLLDEQVIRWRAAGPRRFVQMQESLAIRTRLEPLAAGLVAARRDAATLGRIHDAVRGIRDAIATGDGPLMIAADTAFHRELYLGSGNSMLARLAGTVHACLRVPDFQDFRQFSADTVTRHQHFAEVLSSADPKAAEQEAERLMSLSAELFRAAYRRVAEQSSATGPARGQAHVRRCTEEEAISAMAPAGSHSQVAVAAQ